MASSQGATIAIGATVTGSQTIADLETKLDSIVRKTITMNEANKIAELQNRIAITNLARTNQLLIAKTNLSQRDITMMAAQRNLNENLTHSINNRMMVEQEALRLKRMFGQEGIRISMDEARVATVANQQIIASEQALEAQLKLKRRALMQASISMFVMNISVNQLVTALKPLFKGNEAATEGIKNFQAALNLSLGPMQAFMAMQMLIMNTSLTLTGAIKLLGSALAFSFGLMGALTTRSTELRLAFSALAGVGAVLAATQFLTAVATFSTAGAFATLLAVIGNPFGMLALALGVGATAFAVGSVLSNKPKAQTLTGQMKRVRTGGAAELDPGEIVMRPSAGMGMGGSPTIHMHFPAGTQATPSEARRFGKIFYDQKNKGRTRTTSRRSVSSGT